MPTNVENFIIRSKRRFTIWMAVLFGIGISIYGIVKLMPNSSAQGGTITIDKSNENDWVEGSRDAKVILIEYSDFQCPACGRFYPEVRRLHEDLGDKLLIVYRNFPLRQIHKNAQMAAQAAEAAGRQGKFWEMHNVLFERQNDWSKLANPKKTFIDYARMIGLDADQFTKDIDSREVRNSIDEDYRSGMRASVDSTPTFFLNGEKLVNLKSYDDFTKRITDAIAKNP